LPRAAVIVHLLFEAHETLQWLYSAFRHVGERKGV